MPVISTFFGIGIRMYYEDHEPAHFHAEYQGQQAKFTFRGELLAGAIRSRAAVLLIREWSEIHSRELQANWDRARRGEPLDSVEPLE